VADAPGARRRPEQRPRGRRDRGGSGGGDRDRPGPLRLYATGLPIKSVARRLGIGEETAKQYVRRVREKYAQANRAAPTKVDLYHRAVEDGHLPSPP